MLDKVCYIDYCFIDSVNGLMTHTHTHTQRTLNGYFQVTGGVFGATVTGFNEVILTAMFRNRRIAERLLLEKEHLNELLLASDHFEWYSIDR